MRKAEPTQRLRRRSPKLSRALRRDVGEVLATLDKTLKHPNAPQFRPGSVHRHPFPGMLAATLQIPPDFSTATEQACVTRRVCFPERLERLPMVGLAHHGGFGYAFALAFINYVLEQWQVPLAEDGWFNLRMLSVDQEKRLVGFYRAALEARH